VIYVIHRSLRSYHNFITWPKTSIICSAPPTGLPPDSAIQQLATITSTTHLPPLRSELEKDCIRNIRISAVAYSREVGAGSLSFGQSAVKKQSSVHKHGTNTRNYGNVCIVRCFPSHSRAETDEWLFVDLFTLHRLDTRPSKKLFVYCVHAVRGDEANGQSMPERHTHPIHSILGCGRASSCMDLPMNSL
jgi:hypothetical protein